ncbi:hypothetical protein [Streptosporangium pseudovulgare]|uniref:Secreted protein n=1 Tax=Streptosporangium pseudovulgare TaxID=35765 RepID=A0ABQ2QSH5_9ACTN|nr:hypothetical protein [Streptosporangium pseudovulgare]GGP91399.1 hypothetical protein GCM10010140_21410 [Streptosporangium pseudovulgare]
MDSGTIVAVSATVIAVASLVVSIYQLRATRLHNRHTLRPLLQLRVALIPGGKAGLLLVNTGLGPAIVTGTRAWCDGEPIGPWTRAAAKKMADPTIPGFMRYTLTDGYGLPSGHTTFLLSVDDYDDDLHSTFKKLVEQRFDVEIQYESLYGGENFVVSTRLEAWRTATIAPWAKPDRRQVPEPEDPRTVTAASGEPQEAVAVPEEPRGVAAAPEEPQEVLKGEEDSPPVDR